MIEKWHNTFTLDSKKKRKQKGNGLNIEAFLRLLSWQNDLQER